MSTEIIPSTRSDFIALRRHVFVVSVGANIIIAGLLFLALRYC